MNTEKMMAYQKSYRESHREEKKAHNKAYREAHREKMKAYRAANKDKISAQVKAYREAHKEEMRALTKAWRASHPESVKAAHHRRRARKASAPGKLLAADLRILKSILGEKCLACGKGEMTLDHVKPLARGGANGPTNLQPLCQSCNASKGHHRSTDYRTHAQVKAVIQAFQLTLFEGCA